jgi:hypothetical protein
MAIDTAPPNRGDQNKGSGLMTGQYDTNMDLERDEDLDTEDAYFSDAVVTEPLTTEDVAGPGRGGD